ncbi:MAG TPA: S8 family serine peptidase [Deinococcales bacterium]|nr:S8 family serine peptidase [Deinococcales bacterium]
MKKLLFGAVPLLTLALVACPGGNNPPPSNASVAISRQSMVVPTSGVATFQATVTGTSNDQVEWLVNGIVGGNATVGTITSDGFYTAPAVPPPDGVQITVRLKNDPSKTGSAAVSVIETGGISGIATLDASLPVTTVLPLSPLAALNVPPLPKPFKADWSLPHVAGVVLVTHPGGSLAIQSAAKGVKVQNLGGMLNAVSVPSGQSAQSFAQGLAAQTGAIVQPDYLYRPLAAPPTPNDPHYPDQFYLSQIDAPGAWAVRTAVNDGLLAVLDTGVDLNHEDLAGRILPGKNFCVTLSDTGCSGTSDDISDIPTSVAEGGHGTHTFGIAAAGTSNGVGVSGITWTGKVMMVKVFGYDAQGAASDSVALAQGIRYAADSGAKVINMSLGLPSYNTTVDPDQVLSQAITYADGKDALLIAAAGNYQPSTPDAQKTLFYPASNPLVVAVGAVDPSNHLSAISARGSGLDLMAPGQATVLNNSTGIYATLPGTTYGPQIGTSEAAPQVAAIAALVRSQNPSLTALQTRSILQTSAKNLGAADQFGYGLVQGGAALLKAQAATSGQPDPPAAADRTVYVYADVKCPAGFTGNCYGGYTGDLPSAGRALVTLPAGQRSVNFTIRLSRDGTPITSGDYRVTACINTNGNGQACDSGDIGGTGSPVTYSGPNTSVGTITMNQLP